MDEKEVLAAVQEVAEELLKNKLEAEGELSFVYSSASEEGFPPVVTIKFVGDELGVLIGQRGTNLYSIQKIISQIITHKLGKRISIDLDINDYKERKKKSLEETALKASQQVIDFGVEVSLEPMNPSERRIIHMVLADDKRVITESAGEGYERHIVVKPAK